MLRPICYNPPASRSVLHYTLRRTNLILSGRTKAQMLERMNAAFTAKTAARAGAGFHVVHDGKTAESGRFGRRMDGANDGASWGADLPGSEIMLATSHHAVPEPETIFNDRGRTLV